MAEKALSLDLDGPTIWRIIPTQRKATKEFKQHGPRIYTAMPDFREISPHPNYDSLTPWELLSFLAHQIRFVFPDAGKALLELQDVDVYGNTGRPDKMAWKDMTEGTLQKGGILERFEMIMHRSKGFRTAESKISNVARLRRNYRRVAHADDNPADGLPIAATFPDVDVCIVRDLSTNRLLSGVNLERDFPNVTVVPTLRKALERIYG